MPRPRRRSLVQLPILLAVALAGTGACLPFGQATTPSPTFCDGISSELGGCDADRPVFAGNTCEEVAKEFGRQLDARLVAIYTGPESRIASKAVRAGQYLSVAASLANIRIRRAGLIKECSAPEFVTSAETLFSQELRSHAGELLHDGDPVTYLAWRKTVVDLMSIIDMEEDAPSP